MAGSTGVTDGNSLLSLVSKYAPFLGAVLGTPFAGMGLSIIARALGLDSTKADAIQSALVADPNLALKLKEIEATHATELAQILAQEYAVEVDDRKDARKNSVLYKDFIRHMAYLVTLGFFGALMMLFFPLDIESGHRELLSMLVGMLVSKWQTIIDFFYGSSRPNNHGGLKK
jgi:hypothetical protein